MKVFLSFAMMMMMMMMAMTVAAVITTPAAVVDASSSTSSKSKSDDPFGEDQIDFDFEDDFDDNDNDNKNQQQQQYYFHNNYYDDDQKHPLENKKSWDLELERRRLRQGDQQQQQATTSSSNSRRNLASYAVVEDQEDEDAPYTIMHKKLKRHIPFPGGDTAHGMMIDAGSQGTRLHIYEWDKRILLDQEDLLEVASGQKLSLPTSNSRWTDKYLPGLDVFAHYKTEAKLLKHLRKYLGRLIEFAKHVLKDKQDQWSTYPIYLKATGGLRTLSHSERVRIMDAVRLLFNDHETFNPFQFGDEQARVISGEEEAIYGWVGVNFALQTDFINYSEEGEGIGKGKINPKLTYGMLEMGGASTQIAFFENSRDLMANLFKMQLGGSRHLNVYAHSYLYVGINGAWSRLNSKLYQGYGTNVNPCLPTGSELEFKSWIHTKPDNNTFYRRSAPESTKYNVTMINDVPTFDVDECSKHAYDLLRIDANEKWCDFEMDGNCAFAGIYQPPLPQVTDETTEFVATSNFVDVYEFLELGERANISQIGSAAKEVCKLSWDELKEYNKNLPNQHEDNTLVQMCFRSIFVYHLLADGWGFGENYTLNAVDVINGQKLGWALGCMTYEINTLPWEFHPEFLYKGRNWWQITLYVIFGILFGGMVGFILAMRYNKKFNKRVRESVIFRNLGSITQNSVIRNSLALPAMHSADLNELETLYEAAENEDAEAEKKSLMMTGGDEARGKYYQSTRTEESSGSSNSDGHLNT